MVAANKKRISNELLHIALVITLLRSGPIDNRFHRQQQTPLISSNFFNDEVVRVSQDHILGPSWAYSRTSFPHLHQLYHDPPLHVLKHLEGGALGGEDYWDDPLLDVDLNILNQLRSLTLNRFNSLPRLGKDAPTFQDITAYLLSESTTPPGGASPPQEEEPQQPTTEIMEESLGLVMSPGVDSGHEETGEEDAEPEHPQHTKEYPRVVGDPTQERRDSFGFHSDAEEELITYEVPLEEEARVPDIGAEETVVKTEPPEEVEEEEQEAMYAGQEMDFEMKPEVKQEEQEPELEKEVEQEPVLAEAPADDWQTWFEELTGDGSTRLDTDSHELDQTTLELLEHVHLNEIGGAAGFSPGNDFPSFSASPPVSGDWDQEYFSELLFEAERSSLEFYKKFNDITEMELNNAIAPQDLHIFEEDEDEPSSSASPSSPGGEKGEEVNGKEKDMAEEKEEEKENEAPVASTSSSSAVGSVASGRSSAALPEEEEDAEMLSAMLDDFLEGDSGVFDFFGGASSPERVAQEDEDDVLSNSSLDSSINLSPRRRADSGNSASCSAASSSSEADEKQGAAAEEGEMIQTAPIHAASRPTAHPAQPRGFQVHSRMPGLLRGDRSWQDLATSLLGLQGGNNSGGGDPGNAPYAQHHPHHPHFAPHHHPHHPVYHPHAPTALHPHAAAMHHHGHPFVPPSAAPYTSADTARSVLLQNATLPPAELNVTGAYVNVGMGASSGLGSAVASSMHLTNSSEPMLDPSSHYKMMDPSHDMLYYQNSTGELGASNNGTGGAGPGDNTGAFNFSSILNDDELNLMDLAMVNEGMYSMRVMDNGVGPNVSTGAGGACGPAGAQEDRLEASSDSAVSSMGSERVPPMTEPPLSDDNDGWVDADGATHGAPHDLTSSSYMDGGYARAWRGGEGRGALGGPQKKHQMFGKRFQQENSSTSAYPPQGALSYNGSSQWPEHRGALEGGVHHNHTYSLPPTHPDNPLFKVAKPPAKEKQPKMIKYFKTEDPLTRDEKKARAMNIPITTDDIINLPMDEFNERLSKYDLSEAQLSLIRDIRRRGKNKVAAQNCRKRKLDQIIQLADEVNRIREKKQALSREQSGLLARQQDLKIRYQKLSQTILQAVRRSDGLPYSPYEYEITHAPDGSVLILPRNATNGPPAPPQPSTSAAAASEVAPGSQASGSRGPPHHHHSHHHHLRDKSKDDTSKKE